MLFRRIIVSALMIGFVGGLVLTLGMQLGVTPIIFAAEAFEDPSQGDGGHHQAAQGHHSADVEGAHGHHHDPEPAAGHQHADDAWAPRDGAERTFYTLLSNVLAGIGFAAMMLAVMSQLHLQGTTSVSLPKGLLWGAAGFVIFFAAPGLGLPPEIPGIEAAAIENRQSWWLMCVVATAAGLATLAFAPGARRWFSAPLLLLPFLVGAPHAGGPLFGQADEQAVVALTQLHQQFIIASALSNLVFWLVLGALCAWVVRGRFTPSLAAHA